MNGCNTISISPIQRTLMIGVLASCICSGCKGNGISEDIIDRYIDAKSAYISGDLRQAEEKFRGIRSSCPDFYQARFMHTKTLYFLDDKAEAREALTALLEKEPAYREAEHLLIRILIQEGGEENMGKAKERLDTLLAYDADDPRLHYLRAMIFQAEEDMSSALESLKRASLYSEEFARVYLDMGRMYYIHRADDLALKEIDTCLALLEETSPLYGPVKNLRNKIISSENRK